MDQNNKKKGGCGFWILLLIGIIVVHDFLPFGKEDSAANHGTNSHPSYQQGELSQNSTSQGGPSSGDAGNTNAVDLSAVPEELRTHHFLKTKGQGGCDTLTGQVMITVILVTNPDSAWTDEEVHQLQDTMALEGQLLEQEAGEHGKSLQVGFDYKRGNYANSIDWSDEPEGWQDSVLISVDLPTLWDAQKSLILTHSTKEAPILFVFNTYGRAFARPQSSGEWTEYVVLFGEDLDSFRHELFHLFGAKDFYYPDIVEEAAEKNLPDSIMNSGDKLDSYNAYMVGWADQLTVEAELFLRETASVTEEMLAAENEKELMTGYGTKEFGDGMYTGDLVRGWPHGQGKIIYENGTTYEGQWVNGKYEGTGIYTWDKGSFVGTWKNGSYHGTGTMTWSDGQKYVGGFVSGKRHGKGTYTWGNGDTYTGDWLNGERTGQGSFTWANGDVYTGGFVNGKLDGQGTLTYADGTVRSGKWDDGKYVG